jgi:uncharacterized protein YcnI
MKKAIISGFLAVITVVTLPAVAFAHVVVTPKVASPAQRLVFNVSVPNEKAVAVAKLKVLIPDAVTSVTPTSKEGWTITTTKNTDSEVTSITWTGAIPAGERQDFSFSAQAPAKPTELNWKAYQTYADGSVVHWDQTPTGDHESEDSGPYSITKVSDETLSTKNNDQDSSQIWGAYAIAGLALVVSVGAFVRKK